MADIEERLKAWGNYFKDRRRYGRCGSAEGLFKPHSDDFATEGWGVPETPPDRPVRQRNWVLLAIQTNEELMKLPGLQKWSLTYAYAYPGLPKHIVLRCLKKYAGKRVTWKVYIEQIELGRLRMAAALR